MLRSACRRALSLRAPLTSFSSSSSSSSSSLRHVFTRSAAPAAGATSSASPSTSSGFNWQQLITVWDPPSKAARFKAYESELLALKAESRGAPTEVKPIDWSHWESSIQDKNAVAAIKKEYESLKYETPAGLDLKEINAKMDAHIAQAEKAVPGSKAEIERLQVELVQRLQDKETMCFWTAADYFERFPGTEKQIFDRFEEGWQLPTDAEEKLMELDLGVLTENFKKGIVPSLEDTMVGVSWKFGDVDYKVEDAKNEAFCESIYGGDPDWEQVKAKRAAIREKFNEKQKAFGDRFPK